MFVCIYESFDGTVVHTLLCVNGGRFLFFALRLMVHVPVSLYTYANKWKMMCRQDIK